MGCFQSKGQDAASDAAETKPKQLHALARPDIYKEQRPSFYSVYARAARRYGFETGQYAGFAKRNNVVVKVKGLNDKDTEHEVPAESIQNGACRMRSPSRSFLRLITFLFQSKHLVYCVLFLDMFLTWGA